MSGDMAEQLHATAAVSSGKPFQDIRGTFRSMCAATTSDGDNVHLKAGTYFHSATWNGGKWVAFDTADVYHGATGGCFKRAVTLQAIRR